MAFKSFDQWMRDMCAPGPATPPPNEPLLPDGVFESNGTYYATCCCCGRATELPVGIEELSGTEPYEHYCGGSPHCCP
jgi:hypothetical protein